MFQGAPAKSDWSVMEMGKGRSMSKCPESEKRV